MAAKSPRQRGLFGGYVPPPRDPRGRPRIAWDSQAAETVAVLAADGATQERIAEAVGISVKTLTRIYADELSRAAEMIRQAVLAAQVKKALDGNTPAANFVTRELDKRAAEAVAYRPTVSVAPKAEKLGKKEQRQQAAEQVMAGIFAPGPPPGGTSH